MKGSEPLCVRKIREQAREYVSTATNDDFVDPLSFNAKGMVMHEIKSMDDVPKEIIALFDKMGIPQAEREAILGLSVQLDRNPIYKKIREDMLKKGVEIDTMDNAVKKHEWLRDYLFRLIDIKENKMNAYHAANWKGGVFIHAKGRYELPIHAYFLLASPFMSQSEHSVIIAEPHSSIKLIEGCTAPLLRNFSLHLGGSEIYIKENARVEITKFQNWPSYIHTRPITRVRVEEGGHFRLVNVIFGGGSSTVDRPVIELAGENAVAEIESVIIAESNSRIESSTTIINNANNTKASIKSRSIVKKNGKITVNDRIIANHESHGHIECDSLMLGNGHIETYPGLVSNTKSAVLTHEASIGKIDREQLFYLQTRGLSMAKAIELLVKGFVEPIIMKIPLEYRIEIDRLMSVMIEGSM